MKPPAAIYLRVSKDDGTQTTENQRPEVMQMADARGYAVAPEHVYEDEESGAKGADERPALARLLAAAARGKFRAVFVWKLDRLSRDDTFYGGAMMIADLDRFNVGVLSHQQTWIDSAGPLRNVFVQFAFSLAADERKTLIERTKRGLERARREGKRIGVPPAEVSDAAADRAAELVRKGCNWREARAHLIDEKLLKQYKGGKRAGKFPSHTAVYRACTKRVPELAPATPGKPRSRRHHGG